MGLEGQEIAVPGASVEQTNRRNAASSALLSRDEEYRLCDAWRVHGDYDARNKVILAHMPLAMGLVSKRAGSTGKSNQADLYQEAMIGLIQAMELFDTSKGFRFSTYARWWIRSRLRVATLGENSVVSLRQNTNMKRLQDNFSKALEYEEKRARQRGEDLLPQELRMRAADRIGVPQKLAETSFGKTSYRDDSLNRKIGEHDSSEEAIDLLPDDSTRPDICFEETEKDQRTRDIINAALAQLKDREREVVRCRYLTEDRETLATISERMGVSRERVRQIEVAGLKRIMEIIRKTPGAKRDLLELHGLS